VRTNRQRRFFAPQQYPPLQLAHPHIDRRRVSLFSLYAPLVSSSRSRPERSSFLILASFDFPTYCHPLTRKDAERESGLGSRLEEKETEALARHLSASLGRRTGGNLTAFFESGAAASLAKSGGSSVSAGSYVGPGAGVGAKSSGSGGASSSYAMTTSPGKVTASLSAPSASGFTRTFTGSGFGSGSGSYTGSGVYLVHPILIPV
jgi:hypothetical protein